MAAANKAREPGFSAQAFLSKVGRGRSLTDHPVKQVIFAQGDAADSIFYIHKGKVKLTVVSNRGKEAVIAMVKQANRLKGPEPVAAPSTKECPFCASAIPVKAKRCPHCTSQL